MIAVGMSGGVDSSVSALLLQRQGRALRGVYMHNWEDDGSGGCRAEEDRADALRVCGRLGIPFTVRNFAREYRERVFAQFLEGYRSGWTPNPDILCNREVKFKAFVEDALASGAEQVATGHYVQKAWQGKLAVLLRGADPGKDQSYFLHAISQEGLQRAIFPVGGLPKSRVREIAEEAGLLTARKKDSTGICFIGEKDFRRFLATYLPATPGPITDEKGVEVGQHEGAFYYTIGQKAPVGGVRGRGGEAWFVAAKDVQANTLTVVQGAMNPALMTRRFEAIDATFIAGPPPSDSFEADVQIRHLGEAMPGKVTLDSNGGVTIELVAPIRAVAPGQAAVFYEGAKCLGGATISRLART